MAVAKIYNENTGQWEAAITGPSGVVDVTSPITNTGTPTEANIGIDDATATSVGVLLGFTNQGSNVALGPSSMQDRTTSVQNTALGNSSLPLVTTGNRNTAVGHLSLASNLTGNGNCAFGRETLQFNTDNGNAAFGNTALNANTTGFHNNAFGEVALLNNTTGSSNNAFGRRALLSNTTGDNNTVIGDDAGKNITSGSNNTVIGAGSNASSATVSNEITLGDSNITSLRCNATLSSLSDQRDKTNIQDSPLGLDLIQRLRPVTFDWDRRDGSFAGMKDVGFIAQDVVEVEDELDIEDTLKMSYRENPEKLEIAQARLIPVLTKAIQELSEQNAELKARLDKLEGK